MSPMFWTTKKMTTSLATAQLLSHPHFTTIALTSFCHCNNGDDDGKTLWHCGTMVAMEENEDKFLKKWKDRYVNGVDE
jgi:hypothetical protein